MTVDLEPRVRALELATAKHEAVCAERYATLIESGKAINKRIDWLVMVIGALVLLLMLGEGTILDVARRLFMRAP